MGGGLVSAVTVQDRQWIGQLEGHFQKLIERITAYK